MVPAPIERSESGKQSVCLVELKARFDERHNIEQGRECSSRRACTSPTASPISRCTRRRRSSCAARATGCAATSTSAPATTTRSRRGCTRTSGIFTADEDIAADVADLFNYLTGFGGPGRFRKLLVAPDALRTRLVALIRQVAHAAEGRANAPRSS